MGYFDSVNLLLEHGADLFMPNNEGIAPIEEIVRSDHVELLKCVYKPKTKRDMFNADGYGLIHHAAGVDNS